MARRPRTELRRGWTTGACAAAAAKAAWAALRTGAFPDPVRITLPRGETPAFPLAVEGLDAAAARAGVVKDAGDDPDVTHGALVVSEVREGAPGAGVTFHAGPGVGTVTRPGLPLAVGEPAINPAPRAMIRAALAEVAKGGDVAVTVSVEDGERIAERTWNPRLGIEGGLSILGTTGVVVPYSCAAWIESIRRGVDVARAAGARAVAGCTGATSEAAAQRRLALPDHAMIDMGDFAGGLLKYLRDHPVPVVHIGGGFAKISKLARGHLDLHSGRSGVDLAWLADLAAGAGADAAARAAVAGAGTAAGALAAARAAGVPLADAVAREARATAARVLGGPGVGILVFDRGGRLVGEARPPADG